MITVEKSNPLYIASGSFLGNYDVVVHPSRNEVVNSPECNQQTIKQNRIDTNQQNLPPIQILNVSIDKTRIYVGELATLNIEYSVNAVCNVEFSCGFNNTDLSIIGGSRKQFSFWDVNGGNRKIHNSYTIEAKRAGIFTISGLSISVSPYTDNDVGKTLATPNAYAAVRYFNGKYSVVIPETQIEAIDQPKLNDPDDGKYGGPSSQILEKLIPKIRIESKTILRGRPLESIVIPNVPAGTTMYPVKIINDSSSKEVYFYQDVYDEWQIYYIPSQIIPTLPVLIN